MSFYTGKFKYSVDELNQLERIGQNTRAEGIRKIQECQQVVKDAMKISANSLTRTRDAGYTGRKTWKLAQSVHVVKPVVTEDSVVGEVESNTNVAVYGHMREMGGTVDAVHKQYMTIPIPGRNWGPAWQLKGTGRSFINRSRSGNLIIFLRLGKRSDSAIPIFLLRKSQHYRAQYWIDNAMKNAQPEVDRILSSDWHILDRSYTGINVRGAF
jgi:hypothetical protein